MNKPKYPVLITPHHTGGYLVTLPDFNTVSQAETLEEARSEAELMIELAFDPKNKNNALPKPSHVIYVTPDLA